ncbi:MAG: hypothetical protein ACTHOO_00430 [Alcanivorax sp.]
MLAPVFSATVGVATAPLIAATSFLCLSVEIVRQLLSKNAYDTPSEGLKAAGIERKSYVP